jgi:hypothetical protein
MTVKHKCQHNYHPPTSQWKPEAELINKRRMINQPRHKERQPKQLIATPVSPNMPDGQHDRWQFHDGKIWKWSGDFVMDQTDYKSHIHQMMNPAAE